MKKVCVLIVVVLFVMQVTAVVFAEDAPFPPNRDTEDSMDITDNDKESETYIPDENTISKDDWNSEEQKDNDIDAMDKEGNIFFSFNKPKTFNRGFSISWKTNGTRHYVEVSSGKTCVYSKLHGDRFDDSVIGKKNLKMKDLMPGKTYTVEIVSEKDVWYDDIYDYETYQSEPQIIKITVPKSTKGMSIVKSKKSASTSLYKAIKGKKQKYECYALREKKITAKEIFEGATTEKRMGDYLKNNMTYNMSRSATRIINENAEPVIINGKKYYKYSFKMSHYTTAKQEKKFEKLLKNAIKKAGIKKNMTASKKANMVARWINKNIKNSKRPNKYNKTAYGALVNKKATCRGKSALFYRMMRYVKVPVRILNGQGHSKEYGEQHAINIAKVNSKYYFYDLVSKKYKVGRRSKFVKNFYFDSEVIKILKKYKVAN